MSLAALLLGAALGAAAAPEGTVLVPAGWFELGATDGRFKDALPVRRIWLDAYYIDASEVTVADFSAHAEEAGLEMPKQLNNFQDRPVACVTWKEALDFCRARGMRLPSEAEWEKAAKAGGSAPWPSGDAKRLGDYAWYEKNWAGFYTGAKSLRRVRTRKANAFGLYDMNGNAAEWVLDFYAPGFYAAAPERNPVNGAESEYRVTRGGEFNMPADRVRSDRRSATPPDSRLGNVGFRCAKEAGPGR